MCEGVRAGKIVPYLGPGVLADVTSAVDGSLIPAGDEALILAMNGGKPLNRKLMEEFPRAAMHLELKKGRKFLTNFLSNLYDATPWTGGAVHEWLAALDLPYVIDTNRDLRLQELYAARPHTLVAGIARIAGTDYRFRLWEHDGSDTARSISTRSTPPCPSCSSRSARPGPIRPTLPRTRISSITSPS